MIGRAAIGRAAIGWIAGALVATLAGTAVAEPPRCAAPPELTAIGSPLVRTAARIVQDRALRVVAIGSSSTSGVGASAPARSYPSRLAAEIRARFPGTEITVLNRGVGGQVVADEVARLGRDALALHPDLVIWQVGTNAVLRHDDIAADERLIRRGVALLQAGGIDVVLMDLQYAPRVLAQNSYDAMERAIDAVAHETGVGLFRRFAIMRYWAQAGELAPAPLIGPDGLHMTDASYACLARQLAQALAARWASPVLAGDRANRAAMLRPR